MTQYVRIECKYICQYSDVIAVECEDEFDDLEEFTIPYNQILDQGAINVFADIMELEVTLDWAEKAGIKYHE
tara:strand:+ start:720 stop:935 length:216 start_codon:yes stop_codon:yes gene_type:complete